MNNAKRNGVSESSSHFHTPQDFFNSFNNKQQKLFKKELRKGEVITLNGNTSGIKTLIGWNKELKGYYFFRPPNQKPKFEGIADVIHKNGGYSFYYGIQHDKTHFNGDGINEWCVPPKNILDEYEFTINEGVTE